MASARTPPDHPRRAAGRPGRAGQASLDYLAVLAVVAVLAALGALAAAGASPPALAAQLAASLRHGVCVAAGGVCSPGQARRAGMDACLVHVRREAETTGALVAVVRLRRGDSLQLTRRSDGSASVAFVDGHEVGAEMGVGLQLPGLAPGARATVGTGASFNTGRAYEFSSWADAQRFVERHAERESTRGEALDLARRVSPVHTPQRMPAPRSIVYEAGSWAQMRAEADLLPAGAGGLDGEAEARIGRVLGRSRSGSTSTWYLRLEGHTAAHLGLVAGALGGAAATEAILELTLRDGRATAVAVSGAAQLDGGLSLYGHTTDLGTLSDKLRRAAAGGARGGGQQGLGLEATVSLDLSPPANRAAVDGVLAVLSGRVAPSDWDDRVRVLGRRLDADGAIDLAVHRTASSTQDSSFSLSGGAGLGLERIRLRQTRELVGAWSARGGPLRAREDCTSTA